MSIDIEKYAAERLTTLTITELIYARKSFQVIDIGDMNQVVNMIESQIDEMGLRCRVYTEYRSAVVAGSLLSPAALLGATAGAAIGLHRLATWGPDYELGKNLAYSTLTVMCKKGKS